VTQIRPNVQAIRGDVSGIAEAAPLTEITEEFFDRHFDINVKGALFAVQKALPILRDGGIDQLHVVGGRLEGVARSVGVQRDQGGAALARAHAHDRPEGA
jgi:NAD(P)-dependent dehydrogenase (short-subunit alcohol dehydrogenase family)